MNERSARSITLAACFALAACAGSSDTQPPASSPAAYPASPPGGNAQQAAPRAMPSDTSTPAAAGAAPMSAPASAEATPAPTQPSAQAAADSTRDERGARGGGKSGMADLERAEREIASGDCATACRALGSMERAVAFLCMQAQSDGDANRCTDAKSRLVASRKHVRTSCGSCAGGPSVDPDAPVPSTR